MASSDSGSKGEGISLQTLVIAGAASAAAAIIVSHVWKGGTVIAAAMTPVIVAIVKELLARPMESELVRKPVQQVSRIASSRRNVPGGATARTGRARAATRGTGDPLMPSEPPAPAEARGERGDHGPENGSPPAGDGQLSPMRTYGRARRRPLHLKIAIVTGLVAFAIAAAVLTVPELLFGGAVSSGHSTTLFGGGGGGGSKTKKNGNGTSTQPNQQNPSSQQTTPQQTTPAPTPPTPPVP